jgi:hypothetical protein
VSQELAKQRQPSSFYLILQKLALILKALMKTYCVTKNMLLLWIPKLLLKNKFWTPIPCSRLLVMLRLSKITTAHALVNSSRWILIIWVRCTRLRYLITFSKNLEFAIKLELNAISTFFIKCSAVHHRTPCWRNTGLKLYMTTNIPTSQNAGKHQT